MKYKLKSVDDKLKSVEEYSKLIEDQLFNLTHEVYKMSEQLNNIEKSLESKCECKHEKSDKDEVIEIFNELINDVENSHITIKIEENK